LKRKKNHSSCEAKMWMLKTTFCEQCY